MTILSNIKSTLMYLIELININKYKNTSFEM